MMKNLLIGIAAGVAIGYVVRKMVEEGKFNCVCDEMSELADKTKLKFKNAVDTGLNEAEYLAERVEHAAARAKKN